MQENFPFFTQDFYETDLSIINKVRFTRREIDIIACLVNALGAKKTATLLGLKLSGVHSHLVNIRTKLECNSGAAIISFIEESGKLPAVRHYFYLLQSEILFKKSLQHIAQNSPEKKECCIYIQEKNKDSFLTQLKSALALAGFSTSITTHEKKADYTLFVLPQLIETPLSSFLPKLVKSKNKILLLLREKKSFREMSQEFKKWDLLDFSNLENYFFSFFLMLEKLMPNFNLRPIITEFTDKYKKIQANYKISLTSIEAKLPERLSIYTIYKKWVFSIFICFLLVLIGSALLFFDWNHNNNQTTFIRSDLIIPNESAFLNRSKLIAQIGHAFKNKEGIQTIVLVGIGGSGKTTLARQYAHQQKANVIWEINAETRGSLNNSFENLAIELAKTENDKKELKPIQDIKDTNKRKEHLIQFIKNHLLALSNWFLIFDNVEQFSDIQNYFPQDSDTWGQGRIILTTRDSTIESNPHVNHVIFIGELDSNQKLELFTQIMNRGTKPLTTPQLEEAKLFLENIPPFPLDISAAATYLKATNISYQNYLDSLKSHDQDFENIQKGILKEAGSYIKTRYGIITLSLKNLIKSHGDFRDLLVFISLLDSQNITRDLLNIYKNSTIVDNFIYHLKKYSLITNSFSNASSRSAFSIHRSTQEISLAYLNEYLKLNQEEKLLKKIAYILDDYADQSIEEENFPRMQTIARHLEKFLYHPHLLSNFSKRLLENKLGCIYFFINNDKSKRLLIDNFNWLKTLLSEDSSRLARSLLHLGIVYTELRLDTQAQEVLEKAVDIYRKEGSKKTADLSWALTHLGNIHKKLGNHERERVYLEESIYLHKQSGGDEKRLARTLSYLGDSYRWLGLYKKSIETLEKSLVIYKKHYAHDHFRVGWVFLQLGNVYRRLGNLQKAKDYLEKGLLIFQKHLPENHVNMSFPLTYLGNCCRELGDYNKSNYYLQQSLKIHQKHFDINHVRVGWILLHVANTYLALGNKIEAQKLFDKVLKIYIPHYIKENIDAAYSLKDIAEICIENNALADAEHFIKKSLNILQSRNHVETYRSLETLGEIFLQKCLQLPHTKDSLESQKWRKKAMDTFTQALKIAEQHLPKDNVHTQRLQSKIKNMQLSSK